MVAPVPCLSWFDGISTWGTLVFTLLLCLLWLWGDLSLVSDGVIVRDLSGSVSCDGLFVAVWEFGDASDPGRVHYGHEGGLGVLDQDDWRACQEGLDHFRQVVGSLVLWFWVEHDTGVVILMLLDCKSARCSLVRDVFERVDGLRYSIGLVGGGVGTFVYRIGVLGSGVHSRWGVSGTSRVRSEWGRSEFRYWEGGQIFVWLYVGEDIRSWGRELFVLLKSQFMVLRKYTLRLASQYGCSDGCGVDAVPLFFPGISWLCVVLASILGN
ncbi:hypothetical protein Tco_0099046 [Tanacetum coccineum]